MHSSIVAYVSFYHAVLGYNMGQLFWDRTYPMQERSVLDQEGFLVQPLST